MKNRVCFFLISHFFPINSHWQKFQAPTSWIRFFSKTPGSPPDPAKPAPHYPGVSSINFDAVGALKVYRTLVVLAEYRGGGERWGKNGGDKSGKSTTYIYIYTRNNS